MAHRFYGIALVILGCTIVAATTTVPGTQVLISAPAGAVIGMGIGMILGWGFE